ncbi:MAG: sulfatase/phosphatase domain-containing protein, partial [Planctomycetota bacterium]
TYMDDQVGQILETLSETRKQKQTLVLFTSEQGSQFPGCKWTNWNTGVHTALVARWPGLIEAGRRTDALVQYCDVVPTLLDVAGAADDQADLDGVSFRKVLHGADRSDRPYVYGMHNNVPEGPPYPIRSITDGRHHYITNLTPDQLFIEKHLMGWKGNGALNNPYWGTWVFGSQSSPPTYELIKRYMQRPAEQLYDVASDPYEMTDLSAEPSLQAKKQQLADQLAKWMEAEGDPGISQDTLKALEASRKGQHLYRP